MKNPTAWVLVRPDRMATAMISRDMFCTLGDLRDVSGLPEEVVLAFVTHERAAEYLERCIRYNGKFYGWDIVPVKITAAYFCECVPLEDGRETFTLKRNEEDLVQRHDKTFVSWN